MQVKIYHNLIVTITLLCALLAAGCGESEDNDDPLTDRQEESVEVHPEVIFDVADGEPLYYYIESRGVVEANREIRLKPKISGFIEFSNITEGSNVRKGDTLIKFVDEEWEIKYRQAENAYETALSEYKLEMGMQRSVKQLTGTNGDSLNGRNEKLVRINTGLAKAELDLKQAKLNLAYTTMTAPFSGRLYTENRITGGAYLAAGTEIGRLIDDRTVRIRFDVLETEVNKVNRGMRVHLTAPGGENLAGSVEAVAPVVDTESKTGQIVVKVDNSDRLLKPGMTVEGRIRTEAVSGKARIPRSAILERDGGRTLVFKLNPTNNEVQWIYVTPEAGNAEWVIVNHEDIAPGDTLAVDRHFALSHLQKVTPRMR